MRTNTIPKLNRLQELPTLRPKKKTVSIPEMIFIGSKLLVHSHNLNNYCNNDMKTKSQAIKALFEAKKIVDRVEHRDLMSLEEGRDMCKKYRLNSKK